MSHPPKGQTEILISAYTATTYDLIAAFSSLVVEIHTERALMIATPLYNVPVHPIFYGIQDGGAPRLYLPISPDQRLRFEFHPRAVGQENATFHRFPFYVDNPLALTVFRVFRWTEQAEGHDGPKNRSNIVFERFGVRFEPLRMYETPVEAAAEEPFPGLFGETEK